jgi:hypothetical protein
MTHLTEQQLVLHYYGEEPDAAAHLALCPTCRSEYQDIVRVLDACRDFPVPDPHAAFESKLWHNLNLKPSLLQSLGRTGFRLSRHLWLPALAALLILAFFLGRYTHPTPPPQVAQATSAPGRERILLVALGDHLERSQMVLVELVNTKANASPDIRLAQERARDLVSESRLFRQSASLSGDNEFLSLLDDLERVLTDVANSPAHITSPELRQIQQRIESRGLIFKIRIVDSNLQQKGTEKL